MNLTQTLDLLARNPEAPLDIAQVAFLVAKDEYPDLDVDRWLVGLATLADEIRPTLPGPRRPRLEAFCVQLFQKMGFHGNQTDYYDPRNSYLNDVLQRRTGIPISLSALTMALGQRLDLNIVGLGLPGHFLVKLVDARNGDVIFDPFHAGRRMALEECSDLVRRVTGLPLDPSP